MKELDFDKMFAAGARSLAIERGMQEKYAEDFADGLVKQARRVKIVDDDDDEDEEGTWWSRNKGWALPSLVGLGIFGLGADAIHNGRPGGGIISNAWELFTGRIGRLLGLPNSALMRSLTKADPRKLVTHKHPALVKAENELNELLSYEGNGMEGGSSGTETLNVPQNLIRARPPVDKSQLIDPEDDWAKGLKEWDGKLRPEWNGKIKDPSSAPPGDIDYKSIGQ